MTRADSDLITVCAACQMACCWQGLFMCDDARTANVAKMSRDELRKLDLEHPDYWKTDRRLADEGA